MAVISRLGIDVREPACRLSCKVRVGLACDPPDLPYAFGAPLLPILEQSPLDEIPS
jgi:hypothetical protein